MRDAFLFFLFSLLASYLVARLSVKSGLFLDVPSSKDHGVHNRPVPRAGGIAVFAGVSLVFLYALLNLSLEYHERGQLVLVWVFAFAFFIVGVLDDAGKEIRASLRFLVFAILSCGFLLVSYLLWGEVFLIYDFRLFKIPVWIAFPFTWFAIVGFVNAINISDGLDGLSSGIVANAFFFLGVITDRIGDPFLSFVFTASGAVVSGFWVLNFLVPRLFLKKKVFGIFLGDSGTYFLGFVGAVFSIWAVNRDGLLSPGTPFILFFYPVWETINSMARRAVERRGIFEADNSHFHNFLYEYFGKSHLLASGSILLLHFLIGLYTLVMFSEGEYLILAYSFLISAYSVLYLALEKVVRLRS